ncbi:ABC transporter permease [Fibrobacter sp. UWH4]|uniref:PhnE/PtxC family ABC transporter permease n=1 Tax=Fibrobacter sp. UWH4 TaxID=1896210 RepID=UPI0009204D96|nr:ABC transporter permease subunit [Fibrobacter sp. UWH4]SHL67532.1 phosphonate transport system permease protein [Fibrobacter sp. UWH4]
MTATAIRRTASGKMRIDCIEKNRSASVFLVVMAVLSILGMLYLDIPWSKMLARVPQVAGVFWKLGHLDFSNFDLIGTALWETISITVLSTIYSLLLSIFFGMLAAENIFRCPLLSTSVKAVFSFLRAVPTPVWVLLMMICIGMGPAAGIAGLCVHTTAFFTRAFAQSFEAVPTQTIEALQSAGASRISVFFNAVLPSAIPELVAWTGMRFEINFSECAILGMVGAGGIGYVISTNIEGYEYGTAGLAVLCVFVIAFCIERAFICIKARQRAC